MTPGCSIGWGNARFRSIFNLAGSILKKPSRNLGRRREESEYSWPGQGSLIPSSMNIETLLLSIKWIAVLGELMGTSGSFPSEEVGLRVSSVMLLALEMRHPHHPEIEEWAERLLALSESCPNISEKIMGYARLAYYWVQMGEFPKRGDGDSPAATIVPAKEYSPRKDHNREFS